MMGTYKSLFAAKDYICEVHYHPNSLGVQSSSSVTEVAVPVVKRCRLYCKSEKKSSILFLISTGSQEAQYLPGRDGELLS